MKLCHKAIIDVFGLFFIKKLHNSKLNSNFVSD